eukprot:6211848-Pleurochrysis_carterae.AAC.3
MKRTNTGKGRGLAQTEPKLEQKEEAQKYHATGLLAPGPVCAFHLHVLACLRMIVRAAAFDAAQEGLCPRRPSCALSCVCECMRGGGCMCVRGREYVRGSACVRVTSFQSHRIRVFLHCSVCACARAYVPTNSCVQDCRIFEAGVFF